MEISRDRLIAKALNLGISKEQGEALWLSLENSDKNSTASPFSKMLFYFGALIILSSMTWLMTLSWGLFGGGGILTIALLYMLLFIWLGTKLWKKEDLKIPGGLLITLAVCMTPLAIYGLETYLNVWPEDSTSNYRDFFHVIKSNWIVMEIGTIIAGVIALRFFSFPFLTAPIFFAGWFLTMDIIPLILGDEIDPEKREWISLGFGLIMIVIAYLIDRKKMKDYGFWGYLFGALVFWGNLGALCWDKEEGVLAVYFVVNILMMLLSILLQRRIFMILGAIGAFAYFGHLAYKIFQDSIMFPFVLSFLGLVIIFLGVLYQKNIKWIERKTIQIVPAWLRNLLPDGDRVEKL